MAVTRIVANLTAPNPVELAEFYRDVFELDLPFDMGWIAFLSKDTTQRIELHTASAGGSGTELPVISIGVEDLDATEAAVRAAGAEVVYGRVRESWGQSPLLFPRSSRQSRECCGQLRTEPPPLVPAAWRPHGRHGHLQFRDIPCAARACLRTYARSTRKCMGT